MKTLLRKMFSPILNVFESSDENLVVSPSHRKILIAVSFLFCFLATFVTYLSWGAEDKGFLIPVITFGAVGFVGFIVGTLGTDKAVAKIWGSRS